MMGMPRVAGYVGQGGASGRVLSAPLEATLILHVFLTCGTQGGRPRSWQ